MKKKTSQVEQQSLPFTEDIESGHFFPGAQRNEVLQDILRSLELGSEIVIITGDDGTGKTILCKKLLEDLPVEICCVYFPKILESFDDVVRVLALQLDIECSHEGVSTNALVEDIVTSLHVQGKRLLAIFDDADGLYLATIERIRKMVNVVNRRDPERRRAPLLQVIFAGKPNLILHLKQLLIIDHVKTSKEDTFKLEPFSFAETVAYLAHLFQYRREGLGENPFSLSRAEEIYAEAKGNIRWTTELAEKFLTVSGYSSVTVSSPRSEKKQTAPRISSRQKRQIHAPQLVKRIKRYRVQAMAVGIVVCCLILLWSLGSGGHKETSPAVGLRVKPAVPNIAIIQKVLKPRDIVTGVGKRGAVPSIPVVNSEHVSSDILSLPDGERRKAKGLAEKATTVRAAKAAAEVSKHEDMGRIVVSPLEEKYKKAEEKTQQTVQSTLSGEKGSFSGLKQELLTDTGAEVTPSPVERKIEKIQCLKTKKMVASVGVQESEKLETSADHLPVEKLPPLPSIHPQGVMEDQPPVIHAAERKRKSDLSTASLQKMRQGEPRATGLQGAEGGETSPVQIRAEKNKVVEILYSAAVQRGTRWQKSATKNLYTLQLMVLTERSADKALHGMLQQDDFRSIADKFYILKNASTIFVYYGEYKGFESVRQAKAALPECLKQYDPFPLSVEEAVQKNEVGM